MKSLYTLLLVLFSTILFSQDIITSSDGDYYQCGGTFYDSGGAGGNYSNSEAYTITIYPDAPGRKVSVTFTSFALGTIDVLQIFDGNTTGAPMIGDYDGLNSPVIGATIVSTAADGSLTFFFDSSFSLATDAGWVAIINCIIDCQTVQANLVSTNPPAVGGYIDICQGESIDFVGAGVYPNNNTAYAQADGTSTFTWRFQGLTDETGSSATKTFANGGGYDVNLIVEDVNGCDSDNDIALRVRVSTTPTFVGTTTSAPSVCAGSTVTLTDNVTPTYWETPINNALAGTTFLPDGSGVSYTTQITVDDFDLNEVVTSASDIQSICMNLEHSYIGDLDVWIECPNGTRVSLFDGGDAANTGAYLGTPIDDDSNLAPGTGTDYCFSMSGSGYLPDAATASGGASGFSVPAGTYTPEEPFANLIGCPLNGDWTIEVRDGIANDNGYIFSWGIDFDPALYTIWNFTPGPAVPADITWAGEGVSQGPPATATPVTGPAQNYTLTYVDEYGCSYDTTIVLNVSTSPVLDNPGNQTACDTYTLPVITGTDLTGNEAYFTGTGGTGTQYNVGDPITTVGTTTLYIYDAQTLAPFCSNEVTFDVTIVASPTANAGADMLINCINTSVVLDGTGSSSGSGETYNWTTSGSGNIASDGTTTGPTVDGPGTYTITVTEPINSCTATDDVIVTQDITAPIANAGGDLIIDCANPAIQLDGTGSSSGSGETYNWTTAGGVIDSDGTTTTPTVSAAGTYTITVTNPINGCTATDDVNVTTNVTPPVANAGLDQTVDCANPNATLDGSGSDVGMTYAWSGGNIVSGGATNTAVVDAVATYTLTVTDPATGCTATDDVDVTTGATSLNADAGAPMTIDCNNFSVTLDGSGSDQGAGITYLWTTSDGNIVSGGTSLAPVVDQAGTYTLTASEVGCTAVATVVVTEDLTVPVANAGADLQIDCSNASVTLDGSGSDVGMTYSWTTPDGNITSGNTTMTPDADQAGIYTITVTNTVNGCLSTDVMVVTEDLVFPTANAGIDLSIDCTNLTAVLDGSTSSGGAGITYAWTTTGGNIASGGTTNAATVDADGTYTLTVTNTNNGCVATDDAVVTLNATLPVVNAGLAALIDCSNPTTTLDGTGSESGAGITYAWTTPDGNIVSGSTGTTPVIDAAGTYTLTVTNTTNGCSDSDDVVITDDFTFPTAEAGPGQTITCVALNVTLDGTGSSTGANYTYAWSGGNVVSDGTTLNPTVNQVTTYTITVTDITNGCTSTDNVIVAGSAGMPIADAGLDQEITCSVLTLNLDGSGSEAAAPNITYAWSTTGGNITGGTTTNTTTVDAAGTYTITVTNTTSGCVTTDDVIVSLNNGAPTTSAGADIVLDCNNPALALDGSGSLSGAGVTYNWTTVAGTIVSGATTLTPAVSAAGTYTITVTDANTGCVGTDDVDVTTDFAAPTAVGSYPGDLTCTTTSIILSGAGSSSGNGETYNWTTPDGNIVSNGTTLTPTIDAPGTYTITVTDITNGCSQSDNVIVGLDNTLPTANAGIDDQKDCANPTVTLDGSASSVAAGVTYLWSTTDGNIVSNGTTLTPTVDAAGTYVITVTDGNNGCVQTDDVLITESVAVPNAAAAVTGQIDCITSTLVLDGTGSDAGLDYSWSTTDGNIVSGGTTTSPTVDAGGTYVITVTNLANSCQATASVTVGEDSNAPTAVAGLQQTVDCTAPTITLDASGSSTGAFFTYNWTTPDGNIVADGTTLSPIINSGGTYTIEVTNTLNNCSQTDNVLILEDTAVPAAEAGASASVTCFAPVLTLNGGGSATGGTIGYQWSTLDGNITANDNTLTPSIDAGGTYTITVTDINNGCFATDDVVVMENTTAPIADAGLDGVLSCLNPLVSLDGSNSTTGATISYSWTTTDGLVVGPGNTATDFTVLAGTYTLTVLDASNGCDHSDIMVVTGDLVEPDLQAVTVPAVCENVPTIDLAGYVNISGGVWTGTQGATSSIFDVSVGPGSYTVTYEVTDPVNFCTADTTIDVVVNPNPTIIVNTQSLACVGDSVSVDVSGADSYVWSNGATTNSFYHQVLPGDAFYSVVGTNSSTGCIGSTDFIIEGVDPSVSMLGVQADVVYPYYAEISGVGSDVDGYTWLADGNEVSSDQDLEFIFGQGQHTLTLIGEDSNSGCTDTTQITFELLDPSNIFVPTAFSPNGDGNNDVFRIGASFISSQFMIFNRWGEMIYSDQAQSPTWNGKTLSGIEAQEDVYIYKIIATYSTGEKYEKIGQVTLIR